MAEYQYPSDGIPGMPPYSGVIRSDGRWVPCQYGNEDWEKYEEWAKDPKNHPDPYRSPADGGVAIKLQEGEVPVGVMFDSLPPEPASTSPAPPAPPAPPQQEPPKPPEQHARRDSR